MHLGEVCILTKDVPRLAAWYRALLGLPAGGDDMTHQFIVEAEPMLTVMYDDSERAGQGMCIAFTVEDMEAAYARVQQMGAQVIEPPTKRPWGAVSMRLRDPDGSIVYLRQLPDRT